jgi:hypothetical protein
MGEFENLLTIVHLLSFSRKLRKNITQKVGNKMATTVLGAMFLLRIVFPLTLILSIGTLVERSRMGVG